MSNSVEKEPEVISDRPELEGGTTEVVVSPVELNSITSATGPAPLTTVTPTTTDPTTVIGTRHRRRASDINPTNVAARRMKNTLTTQDAKGKVDNSLRIVPNGLKEGFKGLGRRPLVVMAGILSSIVL